MAGYIKLHRGWRDNAIFGKEYSRGDAWLWLIERACWKPAKVKVKGKYIVIERGELSFSQRFMADAWGWSKSRVDRFIAELRAEGMIETRSKIGASAGHNAGQGQSVISICNYSKYQDQDDALRGNDEPKDGASAGQQRGKEEEGKERKKDNSARARSFDQVGCPEGIADQLWSDFIDLRRRKGAPVTETALAGIKREAAKAGWSLSEALAECSLRGWQGFKAEWVESAERDHLIC